MGEFNGHIIFCCTIFTFFQWKIRVCSKISNCKLVSPSSINTTNNFSPLLSIIKALLSKKPLLKLFKSSIYNDKLNSSPIMIYTKCTEPGEQEPRKQDCLLSRNPNYYHRHA